MEACSRGSWSPARPFFIPIRPGWFVLTSRASNWIWRNFSSTDMHDGARAPRPPRLRDTAAMAPSNLTFMRFEPLDRWTAMSRSPPSAPLQASITPSMIAQERSSGVRFSTRLGPSSAGSSGWRPAAPHVTVFTQRTRLDHCRPKHDALPERASNGLSSAQARPRRPRHSASANAGWLACSRPGGVAMPRPVHPRCPVARATGLGHDPPRATNMFLPKRDCRFTTQDATPPTEKPIPRVLGHSGPS